jgi:hypothetical protein
MQRWHVLCSPPLIDQSGCDCEHVGAVTKLSLAKAGNLPRMRTLLSVWPDGLTPLPETLFAIDATSCTNARSDSNVLLLNGVASIRCGVGNAAPHKSAKYCKVFFHRHGQHSPFK